MAARSGWASTVAARRAAGSAGTSGAAGDAGVLWRRSSWSPGTARSAPERVAEGLVVVVGQEMESPLRRLVEVVVTASAVVAVRIHEDVVEGEEPEDGPLREWGGKS